MTLDDDIRDDGAPEKEGTPGIANTFPRKRIGAGALFRDPAGRILLLEPTYRKTWVLPGGVVEENEDPSDACRREVKEEIGLEVAVTTLLVVDWVPRLGVWGDSLQFTFDGGVLDPATRFTLQEEEIAGYAWVGASALESRLSPSQIRRYHEAMRAIETGVPSYLRFGRRPV